MRTAAAVQKLQILPNVFLATHSSTISSQGQVYLATVCIVFHPIISYGAVYTYVFASDSPSDFMQIGWRYDSLSDMNK
jgi:hypothetical protein